MSIIDCVVFLLGLSFVLKTFIFSKRATSKESYCVYIQDIRES